MNAYTYNKLTDEELNDFLSRVFVQLDPELAQQMMSAVVELSQHRANVVKGTAITLPCKVGDTVYTVDYDDYKDAWDINEVRVYGFHVDADGAYPMNKEYRLIYEPFYTEADAKARYEKLTKGAQS